MNGLNSREEKTRKALMRVLAIAIFSLSLAVGAVANEAQRVQVGGLDVVYGVIPAAVVDAEATTGDSAHMSRENARRGGSHHLVIALFDVNTGQRIADASVSARVEALGGNVESKVLPVMLIAGTTTYGNFFRLDSDTPYRIHLSIQRPGRTDTTKVDWSYRHPTR